MRASQLTELPETGVYSSKDIDNLVKDEVANKALKALLTSDVDSIIGYINVEGKENKDINNVFTEIKKTILMTLIDQKIEWQNLDRKALNYLKAGITRFYWMIEKELKKEKYGYSNENFKQIKRKILEEVPKLNNIIQNKILYSSKKLNKASKELKDGTPEKQGYEALIKLLKEVENLVGRYRKGTIDLKDPISINIIAEKTNKYLDGLSKLNINKDTFDFLIQGVNHILENIEAVEVTLGALSPARPIKEVREKIASRVNTMIKEKTSEAENIVIPQGDIFIDLSQKPLGGGAFGVVYKAKVIGETAVKLRKAGLLNPDDDTIIVKLPRNTEQLVKQKLPANAGPQAIKNHIELAVALFKAEGKISQQAWELAPTIKPTKENTLSITTSSDPNANPVTLKVTAEDVNYNSCRPAIITGIGEVLLSKFAKHGSASHFLMEEYHTLLSKPSCKPSVAIEHSKQLLNFMCDIWQGIMNFHQIGLIQGDMSSDNILISVKTNGKLAAMLADFGLSVQYDTNHPDTPIVIGTTSQWRRAMLSHRDYREVTPSSDIYQLKIVFVEMIANFSGLDFNMLIGTLQRDYLNQLTESSNNPDEAVLNVYINSVKSQNNIALNFLDPKLTMDEYLESAKKQNNFNPNVFLNLLVREMLNSMMLFFSKQVTGYAETISPKEREALPNITQTDLLGYTSTQQIEVAKQNFEFAISKCFQFLNAVEKNEMVRQFDAEIALKFKEEKKLEAMPKSKEEEIAADVVDLYAQNVHLTEDQLDKKEAVKIFVDEELKKVEEAPAQTNEDYGLEIVAKNQSPISVVQTQTQTNADYGLQLVAPASPPGESNPAATATTQQLSSTSTAGLMKGFGGVEAVKDAHAQVQSKNKKEEEKSKKPEETAQYDSANQANSKSVETTKSDNQANNKVETDNHPVTNKQGF